MSSSMLAPGFAEVGGGIEDLVGAVVGQPDPARVGADVAVVAVDPRAGAVVVMRAPAPQCDDLQVAAWTLMIQSCTGVLTIAGSYVAVRLGAREIERRSRREEWWRRYSWAVDSLNSTDRLKAAAGRAMLESLYSTSLAGEHEQTVVLETMWTAVGSSRPAGPSDYRPMDRHWYPYDSQARIARFLVRNDDLAIQNSHLRKIAYRDAELTRMFNAGEQLLEHGAFDFVQVRPFNGVFEIWVIYYLPAPSTEIDIPDLVREMFPGQRFRLAEVDQLAWTSVGKLDENSLTSYPVGPESPL